ncbi:MAG: glutamate racemase [Minisyncoccota bacterium]
MSKERRHKRIGVFDSGFGGLHVLRSIVNTLPRYEYVYLADTARAPYGDRPQESIYTFTKQAVDFLFERECGIVVVACNTASSEAVRRIQDEYLEKRSPRKILGVLIPATEEAAQKTKRRKVGVIATESTVASRKFVRELTKSDPQMKVFQNACPLLVPMIEEGKLDSRELGTILKGYLDPLIREDIDTLILGCTHYGILEKEIRAIVGPNIEIVSQARVVPKKLKKYLEKHTDLEEMLSEQSGIRFYSTDRTGNFDILGSKLFGEEIKAKKVVI